jgi:CubicO group peptidase (beta-lactamase class C family)
LVEVEKMWNFPKYLPVSEIFFYMDQPRPPTRARLSASKMVYPLVAAFLSLSLLFSGSVGLKWQLKEGRKVGQSLCPSYPYPTVDPSTLLKILGPFLEELGQNMSSLIKSTPGGAVVSVVYRDTVIWTHADGLINMSDPTRGRPTADTGFRIGSITKVFAAIMSLMLRDSGELRSLDDNITNYLPQFRIKNPFQTRRGITFRQLSSHMSGLPRNPPCPGVFDTGCNLTDDQIYENLSKMKLMFPPGFQPEYSNLGFGLLGRVLQTIRGPPWEEQVAQMVFKPLNMTNSGNSFTPDAVKNMAVGYYQDGTIAKLIDIGWDAPAGQMYSSASDLSQLLKLIFRPEYPYNIDTEQILDGETIREWMQPAYTYADGTGFGHPWELLQLGNFILRTKAGVMNGYNAELQFAVSRGLYILSIVINSRLLCTVVSSQIVDYYAV